MARFDTLVASGAVLLQDPVPSDEDSDNGEGAHSGHFEFVLRLSSTDNRLGMRLKAKTQQGWRLPVVVVVSLFFVCF